MDRGVIPEPVQSERAHAQDEADYDNQDKSAIGQRGDED